MGRVEEFRTKNKKNLYLQIFYTTVRIEESSSTTRRYGYCPLCKIVPWSNFKIRIVFERVEEFKKYIFKRTLLHEKNHLRVKRTHVLSLLLWGPFNYNPLIKLTL